MTSNRRFLAPQKDSVVRFKDKDDGNAASDLGSLSSDEENRLEDGVS